MKIPYKLIENLEDKAQEIEAEFIEFIQKVPLNYHPSRRGSVLSIGIPEYSWKVLSSDLSEMQNKLVGKYRSWYNQSVAVIKKYLPDDLNEFKKYYKGKNPPREYEIINILQLNVKVWDGNKTGVIKSFQRKFSSQKNILLAINQLEPFEVIEEEQVQVKRGYNRKVFIIHGHDEEMKNSVARTIEKLGLEPIILHEKPSEGNTVIEKFEKHSDVGFAIALLSTDDKGYSIADGPKKAKSRARQNVILETGFFLGSLGRKNVILLYREHDNFEFPSDYQGVIYIPYDKAEAWKLNIIREMNSQGFSLDANLLL